MASNAAATDTVVESVSGEDHVPVQVRFQSGHISVDSGWSRTGKDHEERMCRVGESMPPHHDLQRKERDGALLMTTHHGALPSMA